MQAKRLWLIYAIITTLAWGVWGALLEYAPDGFPDAVVYVVWSLTMIPPALIALGLIQWKLDMAPKAIGLGLLVGFLGAGGQMILLQTVPRLAPSYLVFPFIALNPLVTILLAALFSSERVRLWGWLGIVLALVAGVMLSYEQKVEGAPTERLWLLCAFGVLAAWGLQGFVISKANHVMKAESIFFYMMLAGVVLAPVAWTMAPAELRGGLSMKSAGIVAAIQVLNSIGALLLVYAYRYGKAMIVAPLTNAGAPAITVILSLTVLATAVTTDGEGPGWIKLTGMVLALVATILMAIEEESDADTNGEATS